MRRKLVVLALIALLVPFMPAASETKCGRHSPGLDRRPLGRGAIGALVAMDRCHHPRQPGAPR